MIRNAFRVLLVLWAGSLWSTIWVASTVFALLHDRHLAGVIAARLFTIETYLGLSVCTLGLLPAARMRLIWAYSATALLAVNQWVLKPIMELARTHGTAAGMGFGAWHGVSAVLYLGACVLVLVLVWVSDRG